MFSFEYPWALALLLIFIVCDRWCKEQSDVIFFPHVSSLFLKEDRKISWLNILKWIGISSLIIALASPISTTYQKFDKKDGRDIVLILDASESMGESAFGIFGLRQSKFEIAKEEIDAFISKRSNDRIGLVTFGDAAFSASPLTFDAKFLKSILQMQVVGIAGRRTAINDAITQSYGMLFRSQAKSKIVILLTDGKENQSAVDKDELLSLVSKSPITLYTIGFGNTEEYDALYLQELAKSGHGVAFEARDASALSKIYSAIDIRETAKLEVKAKTYYEYLYIYPLFTAWISLLFWVYFRNVKGI